MATIPQGIAGTTYVPDPDTGFPASGFRFVPITPLSLTAGQTYVLGAEYTFFAHHNYNHSDPGTGIAISTAPEIAYLGARSSSGFSFPTGSDTSPPIGSFGPNFTFDVTIPEPGTYVVWSLLAICGISYHWRRKRIAA